MSDAKKDALASAKRAAKERAKRAAKEKSRQKAEAARAKLAAGQTPTAEESAAAGGGTFTLGSSEMDAKARKWLPWVIGAGLLFLVFKRKR